MLSSAKQTQMGRSFSSSLEVMDGTLATSLLLWRQGQTLRLWTLQDAQLYTMLHVMDTLTAS